MFLGIDLGTGSVKVMLLGEDGQVMGRASQPYPVLAPQPGWAESEPAAWWRALGLACHEALGPHAASVRSLGLSGQMHGLVCSDAAGMALAPAILWSDGRSSGQLAHYRQRLSQAQLASLANPLVAGMLGPSLLWLSQHQPSLCQASRWLLLPKDWLRLRLTGEAATDPSDASATLLARPAADGWAWDIIEALGLADWRGHLPPLLPSAAIAGTLTRRAAAHLGLPAGLPVATGGGDTPVALLGNGLLRPGQSQLAVGSGAQLLAPRASGQADLSLRTHLYRSVLPQDGHQGAPWYALAAMQNAGLALERVRGWLGLSWPAFHAAAFAVADSAGLLFLPYLTGERTPHLDPAARGAFIGLGLNHDQGHLARAALEGVAFAIRDGLEALRQANIGQHGPMTALQLAGGGSQEPQWQQLLCDVLGLPFYQNGMSDASARGAAILAALAIGFYPNAAASAESLPPARLVAEPRLGDGMLVEQYQRFKSMYERLR
jgi:xylulokinase